MSREFLVSCAPYTYQIRSRILGFSFVKRFIRSKSDIRSSKRTEECSSEIIEAVSSLLNHSLLDTVSASTISEQNLNLLEDESSERIENRSDNHMVEPEWYDAGCNPSIDFTVFEPEEPSASNADGEDQARTQVIHDETSPVSRSVPETVSNSMNTSETMTTEGVLMNVLTRSALVTRNIIEFTGALSDLLGTQTGRIRDADPQRTFLLIEGRPRRHFYAEDPTNGESGFTGSSTIGSEISSITGSEASQMQTRNRRIGQDLMPQRYPDMFTDISMDLSMDLSMNMCGSGAGSTEGVIGNVSGVTSSSGGGMDCMPLRPGPFHYLISEQAKSLVALQELQNEVGALLEFRDLVMETFPNLRHKMAATASAGASVMSSSCAQNSHIPLPLSSPSSRRTNEWEPGKVRRRVPREGGGESSSSSLPRSRSNSHSGGTKNNCSATVQDSGFSTETSSKDSASTAIAPRPNSPRPAILDEAEDELWNLLNVIHRKGIRLREEVECLQGRLESVTSEELTSTDILDAVKEVTFLGGDRTAIGPIDGTEDKEGNSQVITLRKEKEQLLDKVAELEAETISSRARAQELQSELAALSALKTGLEDRLRAGLTDASSDIFAPGAQRLQPIAPVLSSPKSNNVSNIKSKSSAFAPVATFAKAHKNRFRTRTIEKNVLLDVAARNEELRDIDVEANVKERRARLGALDSVLISPTRVAHVKDVDSKKIAAILREHSPLELQRHLITTTVHNQVLRKRLDEVQKSTETLSERLDKAREENDDLRFQLEERNIELEGTKARVRVLERLQQRPPTELDPDANGDQPRCEQAGLEPGSSTESARDHHQVVEVKPSPRRRPSRIPLPGSTSKATAPRPPSHGRNDSKESLKSLTRPPRDSSRDSHGGKSLSKARDSSRDSLGNKSLTRNSGNSSGAGSSSSGTGNSKETNRESLNKSLPRNNSSRDSLHKSSSLSRARDSLESNNLGTSSSPGTTPPRRPPAPTRRSYSLARPSTSIDSENGKRLSTDTCLNHDDDPLPKCLIWSAGERAFEPVPGGGPIKKMAPSRVPPVFLSCTEPPSSWCSTNGSFRHSDSSLYTDSLNEETSSVTGSTRVEFIIGSPTRRFRQSSVWPHRYFDSIDSTAMPESLITDDFVANRDDSLFYA